MSTAKTLKTAAETAQTVEMSGNTDSVGATEMAENDERGEHADASALQFVTGWPALSEDDAKAVGEFWEREGAIGNAADAARRLSQVVVFARTAAGEIAGVSTAVAKIPPQFGQPMYYWRTFTGKAWRGTHPNLPMSLLKRSCTVLDAYARERDFPCIGVILELENARFRDILRKPAWWNPPFCYAGKSPRGLDVRVLYFRGSRLKSPAEVQALQLPPG
jgi:hypothetical protein